MKAAKIVALLSAATLCLSVAAFFWQLRATTAMLPSMVHREADQVREMLNRQIGAAQGTVATQINLARQNADRAIRDLRVDLIGEVQGARAGALEEIGNLRAELGGQLTTANRTLAEQTAVLNASVAQVAAVAPPLQQNLADFHEQFMSPTITVADGTKRGNPGALYPRWLALSGEAMRTSDSIRLIAEAQASQAPAQAAAMTKLAENMAGISQDVHHVTAEFVRPRTARERAWAIVQSSTRIAILAWR